MNYENIEGVSIIYSTEPIQLLLLCTTLPYQLSFSDGNVYSYMLSEGENRCTRKRFKCLGELQKGLEYKSLQATDYKS